MPGTSARLLSLLSLLQTRRDWPGQVLAERLAVSERTVRRDVDRLRSLGYPVHAAKGPDGGYRLQAGSELPPLLFDDGQAVALAVALRTAVASGAGIEEDAVRALATVRQLMPSRLRHRVDRLEVSAVARTPTAPSPVDPGVLVVLASAVQAREVVRFDHTAAGATSEADVAPESARRVEPHHVVSRSGRWYLVGWDIDRGDWRVFRVDRMSLRTPNGPRFTRRELPDGHSVDSFLASTFTGSAGAAGWPCVGEVVLDLPASEVAPFAHDGVVEAIDARQCRLTLGSWSWAGLVAALIRYDADLEVVGPPELRDELARVGERLASAAAG